ncbi:MAG: VWA domain-containing protein [Gammaproteobacteria bacterium]
MSAAFIFLRPWWLLALLAVPALILLQRARRGERGAWQRAVDPHLLPHLLETTARVRPFSSTWLLPAGVTMAVLALAGPSWQQQEVALWQVKAPLVIALDLSSAMRATDLPPSRVEQARAKLTSLLRARRGGEVGLIAYAGDAFTAAPITRDAGTVQLVLDSLTPDVMPVDGQRADRAIEQAVALVKSAGFDRGDILLVTDHADAAATNAAHKAAAAGFAVSVLGVGTATGAPMTGAEGFINDAMGKVQIARLDLASLQSLAAAGGGRAVALATGPDAGLADLQSLGLLDPRGPASRGEGVEAGAGSRAAAVVQRSDDGYWLVLALLPLALLTFRSNGGATLALMASLVVSLGQSAPAVAADLARDPATATPAPSRLASAWDSLWQRPDQRARAALEAGDLKRARAVAADPTLRGAAAYRGKDYSAAATEFSAGDSVDTRYNLGNALAKSGDYQKAIAAYDRALTREPGMADAVANRKAVEDALKQQQQDAKSQQDGKSRQGDKGQQGEKSQQGEREKPGQQTQQDEQPPPEGKPSSPSASASKPASGAAEQAARAAAHRDMEQALANKTEAQAEGGPSDTGQPAAPTGLSPAQRAEAEHQQAMTQWLRRVPDDPGGFLRRKFAIEYAQRQSKGEEQ